jgi:flagellar motor switch protein FliM
MPSIVIKMMRQKFDQQWSVRKTHASEAEQERVLRILRGSWLTLEGRLAGPTLTVENLLTLDEGHLMTFDYPVGRPIDLLVNGAARFTGHIVAAGKKRGILVDALAPLGFQGRINEEAGRGGASPPP